MPIPEGQNAFSWTLVQAGKLSTESMRLKIFYSVWASLTAAQKTSLRSEADAVMASVIAELVDIRTAINAL